MNYTIIHLHSDLSNGIFIDSTTKYTQYVDKAVELGMKAIAFTEHGNIFKWVSKKQYCNEKGIKYIHGQEFYVTETLDEKIKDNYHICLYARNWEGVKELNKLSSLAFTKDNHFYYVPRISIDELIKTSNNILVTTACLGGILNKGTDAIKKKFIQFLIQNKHRCFLEIQHHLIKEQIDYNKQLLELHNRYGIPLIVGTDTHSLDIAQADARKILQKAKNISFEDESNWDLTFKTYDELVSLFKQQNAIPLNKVYEALENTNKFADTIESFELDKSNKYPRLWPNSEELFKQKINEGYINRGINKKSKEEQEIYKQRIYEEFEVYKQTDSIDYMLFMKDVVDYAHSNDMWQGYGRGSVNGSLIAYLLGVTEIDSVKYNLNFFRFLNPHRVSLCDIDTDWGEEDRERIKKYLFNYKGVYASEIITFNTIALKGAIRDVARALEIPLDEVNTICKNIEIKEDEYRNKYKELFKYVDILNGTIVSIGTHPSGVLISPIPTDEHIGICTISSTDKPVSVIDMKELDSLNYVKFDILGLDNVKIINETCKLADIDRITPQNLDINDKNVWDSIKEDIVAIFQWESEIAQDYIRKLFSDETIQKIKEQIGDIDYLSLFSFGNGAIRPSGASFRDLAAQGIMKDNGLKELNDFLKDTLGYLTYQEQIMMWLVKFCGYNMAESDNVRRAIAKKKGTEKLIPEIKQRFIEYSTKQYNIDIDTAQKIVEPFIQVILDASNYGFSLNHALPYSLIGYACAYLRYYYPLEFITVALNISKDDLDKTSKLIEYAKKRGINVLPAEFGYSKGEYNFDKTTNSIYKGVGSIKNLNNEVGDKLYELSKNKYTSFVDLLVDIEEQSIANSRQMITLIKLNYFKKFGENKKLLNIYTEFKEGDNRYNKNHKQETKIKRINQLKEIEKQLPNEKIPMIEQIQFEQEALGYVQSTYNIPKKYVLVLEIDKTYSPKLLLHCLNNAKQEWFKMDKKEFNFKKIKVGDVLELQKVIQKPKVKREGDNWVETEDKEWWIKECQVKRF